MRTPKWTVKFETPLESKEFSYKDNIEGYFEKHFSLFAEGKITAIEFEVSGRKASGYTLTATVTYESREEIHPQFMEKPIRWKPIFDPSDWSKRNKSRVWRRESRGERDSDGDEEEE